MDHDVELIRDLLLALEARQLSPRMPVLIALEALAEELARMPEAVADGLDLLLELGYIDGGGRDGPDLWLFRKLTRKGARFVQSARTPQAWARLKRLYTG